MKLNLRCCYPNYPISRKKTVHFIMCVVIALGVIIICTKYGKKFKEALGPLRYASKCNSKPNRDLSKLKCPFSQEFLKHSDVIIVTYANRKWTDIARNWAYSLLKNGVNGTKIIGVFNNKTCKNIGAIKGVHCWPFVDSALYDKLPVKFEEEVDNAHASWGSTEYKSLIVYRTHVTYSLLNCNKTILLTDTDSVFKRDPMPYLQNLQKSLGTELLATKDATEVKLIDMLEERGLVSFYACAGFLFMQPTKAVRDLWAGVMSYQEVEWNDQSALNVCLYLSDHKKLRWQMLDSRLFPHGWRIRHLHDYEDRLRKDNKLVEKRTGPDPYVVHFNHMNGYDKKISHMRKEHLWLYPNDIVTI